MLEGLAHQARWMLDAQLRLAGGPGAATPLVVLAGAAGSNAAWMGSKAAVQDVPLHLVTVAEPVATGAALLAADRAALVRPGSLRLPTRLVAGPEGDREPWRRASARFVAAATGGAVGPATDA
jgi:xylulokinase